jgi:hypothetical protein
MYLMSEVEMSSLLAWKMMFLICSNLLISMVLVRTPYIVLRTAVPFPTRRTQSPMNYLGIRVSSFIVVLMLRSPLLS